MADKLAIDITAARNGFKDYAAAALSSGQPMDAVAMVAIDATKAANAAIVSICAPFLMATLICREPSNDFTEC